jgi:hypothetical protein
MIQSRSILSLKWEALRGKKNEKLLSEKKKRLKLKNHKNKFTFDLNNEHPKLLVFTHSM